MSNIQKISKPGELNKAVHKEFFEELCKFLCEVRNVNSEFLRVRIRDWDFVHESGIATVQIFLSREGKSDVAAFVSLGECAFFHRWLLEQNAFHRFDDSIAIEVSSEGVEPPLRSENDYKEALGKDILLETWAKKNGKMKFSGVLRNVESKPDDGFLVSLDNGKTPLDFLSSEISRAKQIISINDKKKRKNETIASPERDK